MEVSNSGYISTIHQHHCIQIPCYQTSYICFCTSCGKFFYLMDYSFKKIYSLNVKAMRAVVHWLYWIAADLQNGQWEQSEQLALHWILVRFICIHRTAGVRDWKVLSVCSLFLCHAHLKPQGAFNYQGTRIHQPILGE